MAERAGGIGGKRGHGKRKFGDNFYEVYKEYVMSQDYGMDHGIFEKLKAENTGMMKKDRIMLKNKGYKIRVINEECNTIHILYYKI